MRFSDFVDYLLWSLYVREQAHPEASGTFFDLSQSASALEEDIPSQWVYDAVRVLETRGLVRPVLALGGYAAAMLTGEGRLRVEDLLTHPTGYIGRQELMQRLVAIDNGHDEPSPEEQRAPIFDVLNELEQSVNTLPVTQDEKDDLLADVGSIRLQLQKHEPNVDVIAGLLEKAKRYRPLSPPVTQMISLLYP